MVILPKDQWLMERSNDQSLGDAIREFLSTYHLDEKINENKLIHSWEKVAGKVVSRHTTRLYIRNKVLFVALDSPALKNELSYAREKLVRALNREVKSDVITDLVIQ